MSEILNVTIRADGNSFKDIKIIDYIPNYDISNSGRNITIRVLYADLFKIPIQAVRIHREGK